MEIEELREHHFSGMNEVLSVLQPTELTEVQAKLIQKYREIKGIKTVVAVENDRIVGTASMIPENKFLHGGSKAGHIEDVAVLESHQGRGIGRQLVDHLLDYAKNNGYYRVGLACTEENRAFYQKCGFGREQVYMICDIPGNYK